jgi:hypothetical protein
MSAKTEHIRELAICRGCPHIVEVADSFYCRAKNTPGGSSHLLLEDVQSCSIWISPVVNQLKIYGGGYGLILVPTENDDATCELYAGAGGLAFKGKLSELFPGEELIVVPSFEIFSREGKKVTSQVLPLALKKAVDMRESTADPFSSLRK